MTDDRVRRIAWLARVLRCRPAELLELEPATVDGLLALLEGRA